MNTQLLSEWRGKFAQLPISVSWGTIFTDHPGRFWSTLRMRTGIPQPAGDLGQAPRLAWEAMERAGISLDDFMYALKNAHVGVWQECDSCIGTLVGTVPQGRSTSIATYLGEPQGWLSILEQEGVLALISQDIVLWQNKPLLSTPAIRNTHFNSAAPLLDAASRAKQIRWDDFCALLPPRQGASVLARIQAASRAVSTAPVEDFEGLTNRLRDIVIFQTNFTMWIGASTHRVPGCGQLYPQGSMSTVMWLQIMRNQYAHRLLLLGEVLLYNKEETASILDAIVEFGCAKLFGIDGRWTVGAVPTPATTIPRVLLVGHTSTVQSAQDYLLSKLDPRNVSASASHDRRVTRIESALDDPEINEKVRERFAPVLPTRKHTLLSIYQNCDSNWAPLLCTLVVWAENQLARNTTFQLDKDLRSDLTAAADHADRWVPFVDKVLYDPTTKAKDRELLWRESISQVATVDDLQRWNGEIPDGRVLGEREIASLVADLNTSLSRNSELANKVLEEIAQRKPQWNMLLPKTIPELLTRVSSRAAQQVQLPAATGWAIQFLQGLGIKNDNLCAKLQEFDDSEGKDLQYLTPKLADKLLKGLSVKEAVQVRKAIAEQVGITL